MADETDPSERTEEPSQRKLEEAIKRGDVPKSQELATLFVMGGSALVIALLAQQSGAGLVRDLAPLLSEAHAITIDGAGLTRLFGRLVLVFLAAILAPLAALAVAGAAGHMVQHRLLWTTDPLTPKWSKVSPLAGCKRLFSRESLVVFLKGIAKILAVGVGIGVALWPERGRLDTAIGLDMGGLLALVGSLASKALLAVIAVMALVAILDLFHQRRRWHERQRMTRQELKQEYKETEGNPEIKARIKAIRAQRARRRMMAAVPKATVVVTNPTHYAVALRYETGMGAPVCVAKGTDAVALKIREVAQGARVPLVENPPLARALHAAVDIDETIPEEHFRAVAEVIGYVMRLRGQARWRP